METLVPGIRAGITTWQRWHRGTQPAPVHPLRLRGTRGGTTVVVPYYSKQFTHHVTYLVEHSNSRFDSIRYVNRFESIRLVKKSAFRFTSCHAVFSCLFIV